jgi:hypothetical protein
MAALRAAEHFARIGHDAVAAPVPGCETCALVIAGLPTRR